MPAIAAVLCGGSIFAFSKEVRRFHAYMGFTLIFEGLIFLLAGILFTKAGSFNLLIYSMYILMLLAVPFFYYFATRFLLKDEGVRGRDFWMLQTALCFVIFFFPVISRIGAEDRNCFFDMMRGIPTGDSTGASVLLAIDTVAYCLFLAEQLFIQFFCFVNMSGYQKRLETYFSDTRSFNFVRMTLILMAVRFMFCIGFSFFPSIVLSRWFLILLCAACVLFYITQAIFVCRVHYTSEELGQMLEAQNARTAEPKEPVANDFIESRLGALERDNFFLKEDVDLIDIASSIQVNYKYVAEFIKFHHGETFMAYVNRLRIDYSTGLLDDHALTMEDIAERSGFTNVSTFYRNFTKVKGISPSQYRKNSR